LTAVEIFSVGASSDSDGFEIPVDYGDNTVTFTLTTMNLTTHESKTATSVVNVRVVDVPEPASLATLSAGLVACLAYGRHRRRARR
jgi:hypothetical protein